ncbi:MAG: ATP-binding cassette domain-containing protein, partial [Candidatus Rokuibacteriota bacterium]
MLARLLGRRRPIRAVDGVTIDAAAGQTLAVVGESGCGKSTLARCIAGLVAPTSGRLEFKSLDIGDVVEARAPAVLRAIQMVFQNPDSTLNPTHRVGQAIGRTLHRLGGVPRPRVRAEVLRLLREVQLDESFADRLQRQLSGGQKQRVAIARALAARSELVICDEPHLGPRGGGATVPTRARSRPSIRPPGRTTLREPLANLPTDPLGAPRLSPGQRPDEALRDCPDAPLRRLGLAGVGGPLAEPLARHAAQQLADARPLLASGVFERRLQIGGHPPAVDFALAHARDCCATRPLRPGTACGALPGGEDPHEALGTAGGTWAATWAT